MWRWVSIEPPHLEVSHLWRSKYIAPPHLSNGDVAYLEVKFGKQIIVSASIGYLSTEPFTYAIYIVIAFVLEVLYLAITLLLVLLSIGCWCT